MRQEGFYWIKHHYYDKWEVASFFHGHSVPGFWRIPEIGFNFDDSYLFKINESRILDPDEQDELDFQLKADNER